MMTKKQLLQALSILNEDDVVTAQFHSKYSVYPADVRGVNIEFKNNVPQALLLMNEILDDEDKEAA